MQQTNYDQTLELSDLPTLIKDQTKALAFITTNLTNVDNGVVQNLENIGTHLEKIANFITNQEKNKIRNKIN